VNRIGFSGNVHEFSVRGSLSLDKWLNGCYIVNEQGRRTLGFCKLVLGAELYNTALPPQKRSAVSCRLSAPLTGSLQ